ncbi:MAG TPA: metal-dependent phosphohydrolase [Streptosporangiaceae bacterium]
MELIDRWVALAGPDTRRLGAELIARYGEPHRRYHTRAHLTAVLDLVDELFAYAPDADADADVDVDADADADAVRLAAWFHDAVYDPQRSDNEERSARLAERMLANTDLDPARIGEVARLVRLTETHDPTPDDHNGAVLCDADLAVLAGEPSAYAAYASDVREEYGFVSDDAFAHGRAQVLRTLHARPALFRTPAGHDRFESRARHNIETELALLDGGAG